MLRARSTQCWASFLELGLSKQNVLVHDRIMLHKLELVDVLRVFPVRVEESGSGIG